MDAWTACRRDDRYARVVLHGGRLDPSFCIFVSGRSVGRRSAGRRITDHGTRQQSHGRRRSRRVQLSRAVLAPPVLGEGVPGIGAELVSVHVSATDPSRTPSGKPRLALRALLPVGRQRDTHRSTDDDSRYRFARYELSTPEHSRRGRPSSPCPAVAGAKPRDDGLRVASRLPPRSRLGTVTKRAREAIPAGAVRTGRRSAGLPQLSSTRVTLRRVRIACGARHKSAALANAITAAAIAVGSGARACPQRSRRALVFSHEPRSVARRDPSGLAVVRPPSASARPRADRRSEARVPGVASRVSARVTRGAVVVKPRSLVDPASSHMLVSKIKPCMSQCKPH